ncbi:MAG TPA: bifunctional 4-hydroxy-2-oxoglutarate aldolase/2-dehydro-3-deoxy-phosphogluconate aldolase [Acidimicrobiales bacterium]|nr:bifunctional 4-hydroxy-2-oxoglutarate aldolase/2-dehydro-3-deoxy-phosphogluconate aldolase [Acidimicrobiales bacterium]
MPPRKHSVLQTLLETGVVAVIRVDDPTDLLEVSRALSVGGVRMVEITMTVPGALDIIGSVSRQLGDEVFIGAGTVLDAITARMAILAGASFIVGPCFDRETVDMCKLYDTAVMPGCITPTEVVSAWKAGADVVKIFPGRVGTPGYFQDLKGPLPHIRMMPTGNVDLKTAPEYIKAGAVGVGVGKALVDVAAVTARRFDVITENARTFRKIVADARGGK